MVTFFNMELVTLTWIFVVSMQNTPRKHFGFYAIRIYIHIQRVLKCHYHLMTKDGGLLLFKEIITFCYILL
jgi:hypothetical protein